MACLRIAAALSLVASQALACDVPLTDLHDALVTAVPDAQVISSMGTSQFGAEPMRRYLLDFGAGRTLMVLEEYNCRINNLRLMVLTQDASLAEGDLRSVEAVLQTVPVWQAQFAKADLTGAIDALARVEGDNGTSVTLVVDAFIEAASLTSEAVLVATDVSAPGSPFAQSLVLTVSAGGL